MFDFQGEKKKGCVFSYDKKSKGSTTPLKTLVCFFTNFCQSKCFLDCHKLAIDISGTTYRLAKFSDRKTFLPCMGLKKKYTLSYKPLNRLARPG